ARGASIWDKLRRLIDNVRLSWFRWVIEYDLGRQIGLFRGIGDTLGLGKDGFFRSGRFTRWLAAHKLPLGGAMLLLAAAGAGWRRWRGGGYGGRGAGSARPGTGRRAGRSTPWWRSTPRRRGRWRGGVTCARPRPRRASSPRRWSSATRPAAGPSPA